MKKLIKVAISAALLLTLAVPYPNKRISAESIQSDNAKIEQTVNNFFQAYENTNLNYNDASQIMDFLNNDILSLDNKVEKSNAERVELMLERREIIDENNELDLKEYNKNMNITYNEFNIAEDTATVDISVEKEWNYKFSSDVQSGSVDDYEISLKKDNSDWKITSVDGLINEYADSELQQLDSDSTIITETKRKNYLSTFKSDLKEEKKVTEKEIPVASILSSSYNRTSATNYALKYALSPNSAYPYYSEDCTNFISQCLVAGGISMHYGTTGTNTCWYYSSSSSRSSSWAGAKYFRLYLQSTQCKIKWSSSNWSSVANGDIIQLLFNSQAFHSLIVTGIEYGSSGRSDILFCCHTTNKRHVSLAEYYPTATKAYYHITGRE